MADPALHPSWLGPLRDELDAGYMAALQAFVAGEERAGKRVFPPADERFRALALTPLDAVKVVILGQDPYHGEGQAHGLAFSVGRGVKVPPSLRNIFREMKADLDIDQPGHGDLDGWARQGVLLLNATLTVESGRAGSHRAKGWERFTDAVVRLVAAKPGPVVFMLWGNDARRKAAFVEDTGAAGPRLVLTAPHPSPLSAYGGWFGSRHFSQANAFLISHGEAPIDWRLPD